MRIYQRKSVWYIDYSFNGRRVRKKVGTSKKMAELALNQVEISITKGEFLGIKVPTKMIFDKLCEQYLEYSKAHKTERSYLRDMTSIKILLSSFGDKLISEISVHELELHKSIRREVVRPASVNREISCIKHMFNKAVQWGYIAENPFRSVLRFKEPPGRTRYLSQNEITRLLDCCSVQTRQIVIVALNTGMRRGEILNLKWSDVEMRRRTITVRHTKNNEIRTIPMNDVLYETLSNMGPQLPDQYIFVNRDGKRLTTIKTGFRAALRRAGIKDFRFHDLRHTFASYLVMSGADIQTVQRLLGHKDIKMTARYSHLSDSHLREAITRLEYGTNLAQEPQRITAVLAKH